MKTIISVLLLSMFSFSAIAQNDEEKSKGFKKENLFTGGSVTASFYNGGTVLGLSPYFGYSLNKFIDIAISGNINYTSQRDVQSYGDKLRQTLYGPGAFVRIYPIKFVFAQAHFEHNFINLKYIPVPNSGNITQKYSTDANSVLVGGGYCSGRQGSGDTYYYFSVLWDVARLAESPYVDGLGRTVPIIRAGLQIPLFQGNNRSRN